MQSPCLDRSALLRLIGRVEKTARAEFFHGLLQLLQKKAIFGEREMTAKTLSAINLRTLRRKFDSVTVG